MEQLYMLNKLKRQAFIYRLRNVIRSAQELLILADEQATEDSCLREDLFTIKGMVDQMATKRTITEVLNDYTEEGTNLTHIDAYFAEDDGETGMTVAVVCRETGKVISYGEGGAFLNNALVQESIKEVLKDLSVQKDTVWPDPTFMAYVEGGVLQSVTGLNPNRNLTYLHIDRDNIEAEEEFNDFNGTFNQYVIQKLETGPQAFLCKIDGTLKSPKDYFTD